MKTTCQSCQNWTRKDDTSGWCANFKRDMTPTNLCGEWRARQEMAKAKEKIFVAMSGGVDSSVVAALLKEQGHDVVGVTMCFELPSVQGQARPSCCGIESIGDARKVCKALGIEHHTLNYGDALEEAVIKDFVSEYSRGRTPNPCARCNQHLKFVRLWNDVKALGATHLATGHYARIEQTPAGWVMRKGVDPRKDQTYFLYGIPREILPFILFPIGGLKKDEVREIARRHALPVAEKKESQDICFVPDGKYQDFLTARGASLMAPGPFVDHTGKVVGEHKGVGHYTVGQREGLGIALGYPAFVNRIDTATNTVFVGPREALLAKGLLASQLNTVSMNFSKEIVKAGIKIRYNPFEVPGSVEFLGDGRIRIVFDEPQAAVTPGQSVVFYNGDVLLGGAVIDEAIREA